MNSEQVVIFRKISVIFGNEGWQLPREYNTQRWLS